MQRVPLLFTSQNLSTPSFPFNRSHRCITPSLTCSPFLEGSRESDDAPQGRAVSHSTTSRCICALPSCYCAVTAVFPFHHPSSAVLHLPDVPAASLAFVVERIHPQLRFRGGSRTAKERPFFSIFSGRRRVSFVVLCRLFLPSNSPSRVS